MSTLHAQTEQLLMYHPSPSNQKLVQTSCSNNVVSHS